MGDKSHDERFAIYTILTKICINKSFTDYKDLVVGIAKQGGWQKYERDFMAEMRQLPHNQPEYRKADFELLSAAKPGIQLADFYVGAVRACVLEGATSSPYDLVEQQIICMELYELATAESER